MSLDDNRPEYIGDGVYVTFDGWHLELRLNSHTDPVLVYLEPCVMDRLVLYYCKVLDEKVKEKPDAHKDI